MDRINDAIISLGFVEAPADLPLQWPWNEVRPAPFGYGEMPADLKLRRLWQEARTRLMREAMDRSPAACLGSSRDLQDCKRTPDGERYQRILYG